MHKLPWQCSAFCTIKIFERLIYNQVDWANVCCLIWVELVFNCLHSVFYNKSCIYLENHKEVNKFIPGVTGHWLLKVFEALGALHCWFWYPRRAWRMWRQLCPARTGILLDSWGRTGGLGTQGPSAPSSSSTWPHKCVWNPVSATGIPKVLPGQCPHGEVNFGVQAGRGKRQSPFIYYLMCVINVECLFSLCPYWVGNRERPFPFQ